MFNSEEKIREYVLKKVIEQPLLVKPILEACLAGLDAYEKALEAKRESLADTSVRTLILFAMKGWKKSLGKNLAGMIDPLFHQFPKGIDGHSPVEQEFFNYFIENNNYEKDCISTRQWILSTRGELCLKWWIEVIEPLLKG